MANLFRGFNPEVVQDHIRKEYGVVACVKLFFGSESNGNILYVEVDSWDSLRPLLNLSEVYFNEFDARKYGSKYTLILNQTKLKS